MWTFLRVALSRWLYAVNLILVFARGSQVVKVLLDELLAQALLFLSALSLDISLLKLRHKITRISSLSEVVLTFPSAIPLGLDGPLVIDSAYISIID